MECSGSLGTETAGTGETMKVDTLHHKLSGLIKSLEFDTCGGCPWCGSHRPHTIDCTLQKALAAYDAAKSAPAEQINDREDDGYWESRCSDVEDAARNAIDERDALKAECAKLRDELINAKSEARQQQERATSAEERLEAMTVIVTDIKRHLEPIQSGIGRFLMERIKGFEEEAVRAEVCK